MSGKRPSDIERLARQILANRDALGSPLVERVLDQMRAAIEREDARNAHKVKRDYRKALNEFYSLFINDEGRAALKIGFAVT